MEEYIIERFKNLLNILEEFQMETIQAGFTEKELKEIIYLLGYDNYIKTLEDIINLCKLAQYPEDLEDIYEILDSHLGKEWRK